MKWEDYQNNQWELYQNQENREKTDIECPKCSALLWRRTDIILTSYPPQFRYECDACGWIGSGR